MTKHEILSPCDLKLLSKGSDVSTPINFSFYAGQLALVTSAVFLSLLIATGHALAESAKDQDWQFTISPYLWTPALDGDVRPTENVPAASVDMSIEDVLDALNFGAMAAFEARKDRFSILGNLFYADISQKDNITVGNNALIGGNAKVGATTFFAGIGIGYDLYRDKQTQITGWGGLRYWDVENQVRFNGAILNFDQTASENWVDPLVGLSGRYKLGDGFGLAAIADLGGFGVGSDFTWSILAVVNYDINNTARLHFGWRHLEVDYDEPDFLFDVSLTGPLAGVSFQF